MNDLIAFATDPANASLVLGYLAVALAGLAVVEALVALVGGMGRVRREKIEELAERLEADAAEARREAEAPAIAPESEPEAIAPEPEKPRLKVVPPPPPPPPPPVVEEAPVELEEIEEAEAPVQVEEFVPVAEPAPVPEPEPPLTKEGLFKRLRTGLAKTREGLLGRIERLFTGKESLDDETFEELEEVLVTADLGVKTAYKLLHTLEEQYHRNELKNAGDLKKSLKREMTRLLQRDYPPMDLSHKPAVVLVVGVNGVGKTTTIGKLGAKYAREGKRVILAAADTFRAAAVEQLEIWSRRAGVDVVKQEGGTDPAAVIYDACDAALARGADVVICDTAGRLHTKKHLMEELKKIRRTVQKKIPDGPHEVLLVLDATTGQNAIAQAQEFHEAVDLTGLILTKLDGTAKGGIVVGISNELGLPVRFIGVGERVEDLRPFDAAEFIEALY